MCRLALMNKEYLIKEGKDNVLMFLDQLEKSCGGHGNGILLIKDGKIDAHAKDLMLSNELITDVLFDDNYELPDWFLYHTRVASKGSIKNENCHPYVNAQESFGLMMNGTIGSFGAFGNYMGDITDTEALFKMIDTFDVNLEVLTELDPRFIGFKDGKVFASNSSGYSSLVFSKEGDCLCIASESPGKEVWDKLEEEYLWTEGEVVKKATPRASYGKYYGGYDYGNYYTNDEYNSPYYWSNGKWVKAEEDKKDVSSSCKTCNVELSKEEKDIVALEMEDEEDITIQQALELIEDLKAENPKLSYTSLQVVIDDFFGCMPVLSGVECDILVYETKDVLIQDENGAVYMA